MAENLRVRRKEQEAKTQSVEDKHEVEEDSIKLVAKKLDSLLEVDDLQVSESKGDPSSNGILVYTQ